MLAQFKPDQQIVRITLRPPPAFLDHKLFALRLGPRLLLLEVGSLRVELGSGEIKLADGRVRNRSFDARIGISGSLENGLIILDGPVEFLFLKI